MRNRAKCKLCNDIIESYHPTDYVSCKCDEIAVHGGAAMKCAAKDFKNFVRVDDLGNEIVVKVMQNPGITVSGDIPTESTQPSDIPKKSELIDMLKASIESYSNLPPHAMTAPATNADLQSALILIYAILRE